MRRLYIAGQDEHTREWIPVAELREVDEGFELRYTGGAQRLPGFGGIGRMQALDKVYYSRSLFPFFANRILSKSRPEYKDYLRWLGLDSVEGNQFDILSVTSGVRATDSFELVAPPKTDGTTLRLDFFPRGLRYLPPSALSVLMEQGEGDRVALMKDVQNDKDPQAIALRTDKPSAQLIGYVPRYYCLGLNRLIDADSVCVRATLKRVNRDAPLDMKLLVSLEAQVPSNFELLQDVRDFLPLSAVKTERLSEAALLKTDLSL